MVEVQCQKCNYKFETQRKEIKACPYCGAKDSVKTIPNAMDILSDVERDDKRRVIQNQKKE